MIKETLQKVGLKEKEIEVYLMLYTFCSLPASSVAKRTDLNRGTVYSVLKVLMQKGFVRQVQEKERMIFVAVEPQELLGLFDERAREIEDQKRGLAAVISEMEALRLPKMMKPKITFFEGEKGVKQLHQLMLENEQEVCSFLPQHLVPERFRAVVSKEFIRKKKERGVKSRIIAIDSEEGRALQARDAEENRETRLVKESEIPFTAEITMFGNKVAMISYNPQEMMGTLIENAELAGSMRGIFEALWN